MVDVKLARHNKRRTALHRPPTFFDQGCMAGP